MAVAFLCLFCILLVSICYYTSGVNSSKSCEIFLNTQSDIKNLKGVWYRTLESSNSASINSCVHFQVEIMNRRAVKIHVIDKKSNMNISLTGILRPGGKLEISTKVFTVATYNIAVVQNNYLCMYECGDENKNDYVQCATRTTTVSDNLIKRILNHLRSIGMKLNPGSFQRTPECSIKKTQ